MHWGLTKHGQGAAGLSLELVLGTWKHCNHRGLPKLSDIGWSVMSVPY